MKEGIVQGPYDETFTLQFARNILTKSDVEMLLFRDFAANAELAVKLKDPVELYIIDQHRDKKTKSIGELLWFPGSSRGGIITWKKWKNGELYADWTDASNPLDVLERWAWGEMTDEAERED